MNSPICSPSRAKAYITATRAQARDPRAFHFLEQLVAAHRGEVAAIFPDIDARVARFREVIQAASEPGGLEAMAKRNGRKRNMERSRWARSH